MTTVLFAGAGTAGHVEPALAVAHWLRREHPEIEIKFLGTVSGVENSLVPAAGFSLLLIEKAAFPRRVNKELFTWPFRFRRSFLETRRYIREVDLLIGFWWLCCRASISRGKAAREFQYWLTKQMQRWVWLIN